MKERNGRNMVADPRHPCTILSVALMLLSMVLRCIYYPGAGLDAWGLLLYLIIPVAAGAVFVISVLYKGASTLTPTCISVVGGVLFFYLKAFTFAHWWHTVLCCILYTAVLLLYTLTVTGVIRTKVLLYPLFGLPFLFHLFVEDPPLYWFSGLPVFEWLPELSILSIMLSLFFIAAAMKPKAAFLTKLSEND